MFFTLTSRSNYEDCLEITYYTIYGYAYEKIGIFYFDLRNQTNFISLIHF